MSKKIILWLFIMVSFSFSEELTINSFAASKVTGSIHKMHLPIKEPVLLKTDCVEKILLRLNNLDWNLVKDTGSYLSSDYLVFYNKNGKIELSMPADGVLKYKGKIYKTENPGAAVLEIAEIIRKEGLLKLISYDDSLN